MFVPALAALFPAARQAQVTEFFVTRERRATFRQVPGTAKLRPAAATALPGLALAGSWTDTGWPDTMEGAVRSGLNAVIALHENLATPAGVQAAPAAAPAPTGTNPEISGFVTGRRLASEGDAALARGPALETDRVPEMNLVPEVNLVSEVNVVDEDEREVRS